MKLGSLASARPDPIDRNATITVNIYLNQNLSPATVTERWSQTVASGKKAQISTMMASIIRCTTATVQEWAYVQVSVNTTGTNDGICIAQMGHNVVGYGDSQMVGVAGTYAAGSVIKGYTADLSTGGSTRVWVGATVMTYDA
jgi:predicted Zn-dependent protease